MVTAAHERDQFAERREAMVNHALVARGENGDDGTPPQAIDARQMRRCRACVSS